MRENPNPAPRLVNEFAFEFQLNLVQEQQILYNDCFCSDRFISASTIKFLPLVNQFTFLY